MQPYNQNDNEQQQGPKLPTFQQYFKDIPFWCRFIYFGMVFFWMINIFTQIPQNYMQSNLLDTFMNYQVWRPFVSFMFQPYLLMVIFCILNYQTFLPLLEYRKCSSFLMLNFFIQNIVIQVLVILLEYIYYVLFSEFYQCTNGAAGIWFNYMTKFCLFNPALMKLCCCNLKFNRKYFPFVYFAILSLYYWQIRTDMFVGIVLALIQSTSVFQNRKFCLQLKQYEYIQYMMSMIKLTQFQCWVRFQPAKLLQPLCIKNMYSNLESQMKSLLRQNENHQRSTTSAIPKNSPEKNSFQGKQGIRLGDY